jgi:argininosuccinate lyase
MSPARRDGPGDGPVKRDVFLEEARLGPRNPVLIEHDEAPRVAHLRRTFRDYLLVDLAHAVMLVEEGIVDGSRGARLLRGLLDARDLGADGFPWDPRVGSYLVQIEHFLAGRLGDDVAGRLQTGRSRNDEHGAADRLHLRDLLLRAADGLLALQRIVLARAREHAATVMPGYTHLQHAQPVTFGHSLMRHASALDRDLERLAGAFERTNLSALGGAALAGTSWPVNRRRTAELLGHDGLVVNSSDAGVFARDYIEEVVAVLALLMANLGRLATDLYVWHSWEFGFVEVEDGLAGTSSIMPQKKNPHALEHVKAVAGQAIGWLPAVMGCQRGVSSTDLDLAFGDEVLAGYGDTVVSAVRLLAEAVRTLVVHAEVMAAKAGAFWSTASHLADELVRRHDLPFRTAHHVVARFVRDAVARRQGPAEAAPELLTAALREVAGLDVVVAEAELRRLLDPRHFVESRVTEGSVNPRQVLAHVAEMERVLTARTRWHADRVAQVEGALDRLVARARALAAGTGGR